MISAVRTTDYRKSSPSATRRGSKPAYNPLHSMAKTVADEAYERAMKVAELLAPEQPTDTEPLDDFDQWNILQMAAVSFSPGYWDDPEALTALYDLKKKFTGREDPQLLEFAKTAKARKDALPPPDMTPRNPKWDEEMQKMGVK